MLFNSAVFLFGFLPLALCGYQLLARFRPAAVVPWMTFASLVFYGYWDVRYLALIALSIGGNYLVGQRLNAAAAAGANRKAWLVLGIVANLALLGWYKYANFFLATAASLGAGSIKLDLILPLGISFFTFTQIAFLADSYRGLAREYRFLHYALFVTYFPHLIAGPILHHGEMVPQFGRRLQAGLRAASVAPGLTLFIIGLFKKVVLADSIAPLADACFAAAGSGAPLTFLEAWAGTLAYSFQIYFDFSGYTDMALGLSLLFNVRLPRNFASPYQAASPIDFWRRWHITLSRFLREYLYIPLGGSRRGTARRYLNLLLTMLLGGLWHGAGWTFVLWGGYHGLLLVINHAWRRITNATLDRTLAMLMTFIAVTLGWVLFRASDLPSALRLYAALFGANGLGLESILQQTTLAPAQIFPHLAQAMDPPLAGALLLLLACITWGLPNSGEYLGRVRTALAASQRSVVRAACLWRPTVGHATLCALLLSSALVLINKPSPFLYFQF